MATRPAARLLRKALCAEADPGAATDRELLRRFAKEKDQAAFAALVGRHGPMVLAACRRVLGNPADAEDACQAAFLVLARKAESARWQPSVAGWLYATARQVALNARTARNRRAKYEAKAPARPPASPLAEITGEELLAILDEELGKLPERYRAPLVLCGLEGLTRDEAAHQLGVPAATLKSHLERGRQRLHDALAKRGVALGAGLLVLLATSPAGAVPPRLAESVAAAAAGAVPPRVAALAQGVAMTGGKKFATAAVFAAGFGLLVLAAGLGRLPAGDAGPPTAPLAAPKAADSPPRALLAKPDEPKVQPAAGQLGKVAGKVIDADGKAIGGATLRVWTDGTKDFKELPERAKTAADGSFELAVTAAELDKQATVVATAEGFAPDWVKVGEVKPDRPVSLRLHRDNLPVSGRILSLEGKPIAGVTVEVVRVGKYTDGDDLKGWIDHHQELRAKGYAYIRTKLNLLRPEACGQPRTFTTDADGKVTLAGFGRNRVLWLKIRGETVETRGMKAMTYPGPAESFDPTHPGEDALFGNTFVQHLGPTKPIVGTVRDRKTGKPIAGAIVEDASGSYRATAVTDPNGRYRLVGLPKMQKYPVGVGGKPGVPYFDASSWEIEDTPGLDPLTKDFELDRGVEVTGRLTDKATGKPVPGEVRYFEREDNKLARERPKSGRVVGEWGTVGKDGRFRTLVDPGPGILIVVTNDPKPYPFANINELFGKYRVNGFPMQPMQAIVPIDANEADPKSLTHDIALTPAVEVEGTLVDPDGRPLAGVRAAGLAPPDLMQLLRRDDKPNPTRDRLKTANFTAIGVHPDEPRTLVFADPEKKLGKVYVLPAGERGPVTVRLELLAAASGRVVDAAGKPLVGAKVAVQIASPWKDASFTLPAELAHNFPAWLDVQSREVVADENGRFTAEGLLPGIKYGVWVKAGEEYVTVRPAAIPLAPGKTTALGDLKFDPAAAKEGDE
jgi:RNA polymerase sigma factor (sigma-70 family)